MKYELLENTDIGIIVDATPIFRDIKDTFVVSFILPEKGVYIALFRGENGVEYRASIKDGILNVPKILLDKSQRVTVTVFRVEDNEIIKIWKCPPLQVGIFSPMRDTYRQITIAMTGEELVERLTALEQKCESLQSDILTLSQNMELWNADMQ